jgi:hypothetical protein
MRRVITFAHVVFWSVVALAFIALSAPEIHRGALSQSIHPLSPYHSTDSFLRFTTESTLASERLISLFEALPPAKPVLVFIGPDDPRSLLLGMVSAYLAEPHPVQLVNSGAEARKAISSINSEAPAALVFCRLRPPPGIAAGKTFGKLEISSSAAQ